MITLKDFKTIFQGLPAIVPDYVLEAAFERYEALLKEKELRAPSQQVIAQYIQLRASKGLGRPVLDPVDTTRLKRMLDSPSRSATAEQMIHLMHVYFSFDDPWLKEWGYPLNSFLNRLSKLQMVSESRERMDARMPTTTKPTLEMHQGPVQGVLPPPDVAGKLAEIMKRPMNRMPDKSPPVDFEARRSELERQADAIKKGKP